jgi:hypothetical protein
MKKTRVILASVALFGASLACRMNVGGPTPSGPPIPISTEAAGSLQQQFKQSFEGSNQNEQLTLTINETQLTSLLAARLASLPEPFISEPQVYLRDGQIQIYGKATQSYFEANVGIILTAVIDEQGLPLLEVHSGTGKFNQYNFVHGAGGIYRSPGASCDRVCSRFNHHR